MNLDCRHRRLSASANSSQFLLGLEVLGGLHLTLILQLCNSLLMLPAHLQMPNWSACIAFDTPVQKERFCHWDPPTSASTKGRCVILYTWYVDGQAAAVTTAFTSEVICHLPMS